MQRPRQGALLAVHRCRLIGKLTFALVLNLVVLALVVAVVLLVVLVGGGRGGGGGRAGGGRRGGATLVAGGHARNELRLHQWLLLDSSILLTRLRGHWVL